MFVCLCAPPCGLPAVYFVLRTRRAVREDRMQDAWRYSTHALLFCFAGFALISLLMVLWYVLFALHRFGIIQSNRVMSPRMNVTTKAAVTDVTPVDASGTRVYPSTRRESGLTICIFMCDLRSQTTTMPNAGHSD